MIIVLSVDSCKECPLKKAYFFDGFYCKFLDDTSRGKILSLKFVKEGTISEKCTYKQVDDRLEAAHRQPMESQ